MAVERWTFLCSSNIPSLSRNGEHCRLAYDPQMLLSIMEVSNSIEDQTVRMVALASKTDDAIPLTKILPERTGGVSFVRRSCRRLFSPLLRVSVCTYGMASNIYVLSGHFFSRLFLAIHQPGARENGNLFSQRCGQFGFTGTTWSSKVVPPQSTQFSTIQGGLLFSGNEAVWTPLVLDFCNGLFVPRH